VTTVTTGTIVESGLLHLRNLAAQQRDVVRILNGGAA
jgi:hypothetical protein